MLKKNTTFNQKRKLIFYNHVDYLSNQEVYDSYYI